MNIFSTKVNKRVIKKVSNVDLQLETLLSIILRNFLSIT